MIAYAIKNIKANMYVTGGGLLAKIVCYAILEREKRYIDIIYEHFIKSSRITKPENYKIVKVKIEEIPDDQA